MPIGEPKGWSEARKARLASQYPVIFGGTSARDVIGTDAFNIANGGPPTNFGQTAMKLAAHSGRLLPKRG